MDQVNIYLVLGTKHGSGEYMYSTVLGTKHGSCEYISSTWYETWISWIYTYLVLVTSHGSGKDTISWYFGTSMVKWRYSWLLWNMTRLKIYHDSNASCHGSVRADKYPQIVEYNFCKIGQGVRHWTIIAIALSRHAQSTHTNYAQECFHYLLNRVRT